MLICFCMLPALTFPLGLGPCRFLQLNRVAAAQNGLCFLVCSRFLCIRCAVSCVPKVFGSQFATACQRMTSMPPLLRGPLLRLRVPRHDLPWITGRKRDIMPLLGALLLLWGCRSRAPIRSTKSLLEALSRRV